MLYKAILMVNNATMRFSEKFGLQKTQAELDFVDVPLHTDIPLFLDPHVIANRDDLFSVRCNNIIVNFFQGVIDDIKNGRDSVAKYKLNNLNEPNETHLGLSSKKSQGKGVSGKQSMDVYKKLKGSRAVLSGLLQDLSDSELVIEGISNDKISDITTNIIKKELIEYTTSQCNTYDISTQSVSSGKYWDPVAQTWKNEYAELPVFKDKAVLLVPKVLARYRIQFDHKKYYNRFVLDYLQEEHISANTSLVKLLKNGCKKVYKKDLKKDVRYKLSKDFLYEFSKEHPDVLANYRKSVARNIDPLTDKQIELKQPSPKTIDFQKLEEKLTAIPSGIENADNYHNVIIGILEAIFSPNLYSPTKEEPLHEGRKSIDITYINGARHGFFEYLSKHVPSQVIICECKNYKEDPDNPALDQLAMRFGKVRKFGFLVCRKVDNKLKMRNHCKDRADDEHGYIVVLDDNDLIHLLRLKKELREEDIDAFLIERYKELILDA